MLKEAKSNSEMTFWVRVSRFGLHTPTKNFEHASPNSKAQQFRHVESLTPCLAGSCILWGAATDASADISVDTSVDTRSCIGRYPIEYRSIYRSSIDRCIDRYYYRSIYLVAHRDFTETSPILHRYCTDASPTLYLHRVY